MPRTLLLNIYREALAAVDGRVRVAQWLREHPLAAPLHLLALGKAAPAMARGALEVAGESIERALVITKHGYGEPLNGDCPVTCLEAGHPLPDADSLAAGAALLQFVDAIPAEAHLLMLLSGGASALAEALPDGVELASLAALNDWLLASGWPIERMNRLRKGLSRIKGGRLAARLNGRPATVLLLSDVPGDDPAVIGSGPLAPDPAAGEPLPLETLPASLSALFTRRDPVPSPDDACFRNIRHHLIASNRDARHAAAEAGRRYGFNVYHSDELVVGDAIVQGEVLARTLIASEPGLYIHGGETTVVLPPEPGRGGRCQALALAAARPLAGHQVCLLLAAGTDGSDGPTEEAGALVDGGSLERGEAEGFSAAEALRRADAGRFLEASGDLIQTGPTGSNVMDLILGLHLAGNAGRIQT